MHSEAGHKEDSMVENDPVTKVATTEDKMEYPPPAQAALVMLALLLALFLSALVSRQTLTAGRKARTSTAADVHRIAQS